MEKLRTQNKVREWLSEDNYKPTGSKTNKTNRSIYENYEGDRVLVDWEHKTIENVYSIDGYWFHLYNM